MVYIATIDNLMSKTNENSSASKSSLTPTNPCSLQSQMRKTLNEETKT